MNTPDEAAPPSPNFYAIIPAPVLYCASLPPAAKLLFGEIVALTSVRGYCFAQNPHFVERHGVSSRAVQKWLAALSKHGFINIEFVGEERRIYATAMLPNPSAQGRKKVHTPPNKSSYRVLNLILKRIIKKNYLRARSSSAPVRLLLVSYKPKKKRGRLRLQLLRAIPEIREGLGPLNRRSLSAGILRLGTNSGICGTQLIRPGVALKYGVAGWTP